MFINANEFSYVSVIRKMLRYFLFFTIIAYHPMTKTAFMQLKAEPTFMKARNSITHLPHGHLKDCSPVLSVVVAQQGHVRQEQLLDLKEVTVTARLYSTEPIFLSELWIVVP